MPEFKNWKVSGCIKENLQRIAEKTAEPVTEEIKVMKKHVINGKEVLCEVVEKKIIEDPSMFRISDMIRAEIIVNDESELFYAY